MINPENLKNKELPDKKHFYNMLTLKDITDKKYKEVKNFYKKYEI